MLHDFANMMQKVVTTRLDLGNRRSGLFFDGNTLDIMSENVEEEQNCFLDNVRCAETISILENLDDHVPNIDVADLEDSKKLWIGK